MEVVYCCEAEAVEMWTWIPVHVLVELQGDDAFENVGDLPAAEEFEVFFSRQVQAIAEGVVPLNEGIFVRGVNPVVLTVDDYFSGTRVNPFSTGEGVYVGTDATRICDRLQRGHAEYPGSCG